MLGEGNYDYLSYHGIAGHEVADVDDINDTLAVAPANIRLFL